MSDGPHRSLPLRPHWKTFARRAANAAHTADEVQESLAHALKRDILKAPIKSIRDIMGGDSLFPAMKIEQLEALRPSCSGSAPANSAIDCAIAAASNGITGDAGTQTAIQLALEDTLQSHVRSIEEHYQREASPQGRNFMQSRLEAITGHFDCGVLAREILSSEKPPAHHTVKLTTRSGLDQGPAL
jgi:hypothetical protein